jgi:hypothetical protein
MMRLIGTLLVITVAMSARPVLAESPAPGVRLVSLGTVATGRPQTVAMSERWAFLVVGAQVQVLDLAEPTAPRLAGTTGLSAAGVVDVAATGDTFFSLLGDGTLNAFAMTQDGQVVALSSLPGAFDGQPMALDARADRACIAGWGGLSLVDLADPAAMRVLAQLDFEDRRRDTTGCLLAGEHVLVAQLGGFAVVDASEPSSPWLLGQLDFENGWTPNALATHGDRALLVGGYWPAPVISVPGEPPDMMVISLADPARPAPVARLSMPGWSASAIAVRGGMAYLSGIARAERPRVWDTSLRVLDLAAPGGPVELREVPYGQGVGDVAGVAVAGPAGPDLALAIDGEAATVLSLADPDRPAPMGAFSPAAVRGPAIAVDSSLVSLDGFLSYLQIVDLPNPARPAVAGFPTQLFQPGPLIVSQRQGSGSNRNRWAYLMDRYIENRWDVYDLADPLRASRVGTVVHSATVAGMAARGDTLYLLEHSGWLRALDVSRPLRPVLRWSADTGERCTWGTQALLLTAHALVGERCGEPGLFVLPAEAAAAVSGAAHLTVPEDASDLAVSGNTLLLRTRGTGSAPVVQPYDLRDPARPRPLAPWPGCAAALAAYGSYAYVADCGGRLHAIDLSDPASPVTRASTDLSGWNAAATFTSPQLLADGDRVIATVAGGHQMDVLRRLGPGRPVYLPALTVAK